MCISHGFGVSAEGHLPCSGVEQQAATSALRKAKRCRALGCTVQDLGGSYCRKKRLCEAHMKADAIEAPECGPGMWRYCQQCGKLEQLHRFEGTKRSCRASLVKRKANADKAMYRQQRRQQQQQQQYAAQL
ncbi:hypothetical protein OEZ86_012196 [Tetradesmus obliquus]|nr:hypothetical protein OEZ86_012196 [Tetradesmus obliquus]